MMPQCVNIGVLASSRPSDHLRGGLPTVGEAGGGAGRCRGACGRGGEQEEVEGVSDVVRWVVVVEHQWRG